jgi:HPt (histidine-containing phosphotransfer) domain-containing protein
MINWEKLNEFFQYFDKEVVVEVIKVFIKECPERVENIRKSLEVNDCKSLEFNAHKLNGSLKNLWAHEVIPEASKLEEIGRSGKITGTAGLFSQLSASTTELITELEEYLKKEG